MAIFTSVSTLLLTVFVSVRAVIILLVLVLLPDRMSHEIVHGTLHEHLQTSSCVYKASDRRAYLRDHRAKTD